MKNIFIIDDNHTMAECIARACRAVQHKEPTHHQTATKHKKENQDKNNQNGSLQTYIFSNAIEATAALNEVTPDLIFLDILLDGPDGFTFLHELSSYTDTAKIPVVIVSSLDFKNRDLSIYGVVGILHKDTMTPQDIQRFLHD